MSDPVQVYGQCQYEGDFGKVESILEKWGYIGLLIPLGPGEFVLEGCYHSASEGARGPVQEEDLQDCLNEIAVDLGIQSGTRAPVPSSWTHPSGSRVPNANRKRPAELAQTDIGSDHGRAGTEPSSRGSDTQT